MVIQPIEKTRRASASFSLKSRPGCKYTVTAASRGVQTGVCSAPTIGFEEHYNIRYYNIIGR